LTESGGEPGCLIDQKGIVWTNDGPDAVAKRVTPDLRSADGNLADFPDGERLVEKSDRDIHLASSLDDLSGQ
jgi:hypothetical protein